MSQEGNENKVFVPIRLYRMHDLDLITFIKAHQLDLQQAMYCAVKAFCNDDHFVITIPPLREDWEKTEFKKMYRRNLYLDAEKDQDIIEMLRKIEDGYRNNFLKNLLRLYLCNPMSEFFLKHVEDSQYFYEKFNVFRKGRREADAGDQSKALLNGNVDGLHETVIESQDEEKKDNGQITEPISTTEEQPVSIESQTIEISPVNNDENNTNDDAEEDDNMLDMFLSIAD